MNNRLSAPNLAQLYRAAAEHWRGLPAFSTREKTSAWSTLTFDALYDQGLSLATALIDLGVEARELVGLFGDNRREWILADYGVQLCGAADVPRGRDVTDAELCYICTHATIRVAFVETTAMQEKILRVKKDLPDLRHVILMDPDVEPAPGVLRLSDLVARGGELRANGDARAEARIQKIDSEDLFTLIYTSGTTGNPKGVMLTHANMMYQIRAVPIDITSSDRILSILPIWHIFERVFEMLAIGCGACTYYSSRRTLAEDLKRVRPTFMGSAPRLWENLHQRILRTVGTAPPIRRLLFRMAYATSRWSHDSQCFLKQRQLAITPEALRSRPIRRCLHLVRYLLIRPFHLLLDELVLKRIRSAVGGCLKATVSGGGALPGEIDRFFNYIGIPVLEGYGLTETCPVVAVRTQEQLVIGTVGPLLPGTDVRIRDLDGNRILYPDADAPGQGRGLRGEICVRGPQVMKGYYKSPEATERVLADGWFRTGDLGMITYNDCLKVLGRSKETIVLSSGENLEPGPIEQRLCQSPLIDQCMVVGQDCKFIAVLIVPDLEGLREAGAGTETLEEVQANPKAVQCIRDDIRNRISTANGFKPFERVSDFRLLPKPFTVGDELTNLFKLKRHVVEGKYSELIRDMFNGKKRKDS